MTDRAMSDREMWLLLADDWRPQNLSEGNDGRIYSLPTGSVCLCDTLDAYRKRGLISAEQCSRLQMIASANGTYGANYRWLPNAEGARGRVKFCEAMANA